MNNPTLSLLQSKPANYLATANQALKSTAPMLSSPKRKSVTIAKPPSFVQQYKDTLVEDIVRKNAIDGRYIPSSSGNSYGVKDALWSKVSPYIDKYKLSVIQGYRDPNNLPEGSKSAGNSQHFYGNAMDLNYGSLDTLRRISLIKDLQAAGITGFGVGNNTLHADIGPKRHWTYDSKGNWISGLPSWAQPLF